MFVEGNPSAIAGFQETLCLRQNILKNSLYNAKLQAKLQHNAKSKQYHINKGKKKERHSSK